jgi:hypothetical protein
VARHCRHRPASSRKDGNSEPGVPTGDAGATAQGRIARRPAATGETETPKIDGGFEDPDAYLNVTGPDLWIEVEPPGHVEAVDLEGSYGDVALSEPDRGLCLWLTIAQVPVGVPGGSAEVTWRLFEDLANRYDGVAVETSE